MFSFFQTHGICHKMRLHKNKINNAHFLALNTAGYRLLIRTAVEKTDISFLTHRLSVIPLGCLKMY